MSERDQITLLFVLSAVLAVGCLTLLLLGQLAVALSTGAVALCLTIVGYELRKKINNG